MPDETKELRDLLTQARLDIVKLTTGVKAHWASDEDSCVQAKEERTVLFDRTSQANGRLTELEKFQAAVLERESLRGLGWRNKKWLIGIIVTVIVFCGGLVTWAVSFLGG